MPVDRELAMESLKYLDPEIYRVYLKLRYRGMAEEEVAQSRGEVFKLALYMEYLDALDRLEAIGEIEIINDHDGPKYRRKPIGGEDGVQV